MNLIKCHFFKQIWVQMQGLVILMALLVPITLQAKMIFIKGGVYTPLYGSNKKPSQVGNFWVEQFPVTNFEFLQFVKAQDSWQRKNVKKIFADKTYLGHWQDERVLGPKAGLRSPVVNVSWYAAHNYCNYEGARLPSVDEWEYLAAKKIKGTKTAKLILEWYSKPTPEQLPAVDTGLKNISGVFALHGFIWEWTQDFNSAMVTGESRGDSVLDKNFFCGAGSIGAADSTNYAAFMRFAFRSSLKANYTVANLGFRCAKDYTAPSIKRKKEKIL